VRKPRKLWWLDDDQEPPKPVSRAPKAPPERRRTPGEWFQAMREVNQAAPDTLRRAFRG
jgi:hypothetical protein